MPAASNEAAGIFYQWLPERAAGSEADASAEEEAMIELMVGSEQVRVAYRDYRRIRVEQGANTTGEFEADGRLRTEAEGTT